MAPSEPRTNASGLKPFETKGLPERQAQTHELKIIQSIKEMYSCSPTATTFDVYANNSQFEDPIGIAKGRDSIRAQFIGLAKIFDKAEIPKFRVLENPASVPDNVILIDQDVSYYRDSTKEPIKTLNSLLTIATNDQNQILHHTEEWNYEKSVSSEDGFFGMLNEQRKKLTATLTHVAVGKDKTE
ncbi:SnoaL-like domain-containing protein [Pleurotus pulmonarius]